MYVKLCHLFFIEKESERERECEREREREREKGREKNKEKYDLLGFLMFTDVKTIVSQTTKWKYYDTDN